MTRRNAFRVSKLSLGLIAALAAAPVFAQSATSAGVGGVVIGSDGQPVTNAEVTIVHVESGTTSRVTTDASGRYSARGLRVGGPYEITITKAGAGTKTEDNVYLGLNAANTVNAQLTGDVTTLATVTAVGVAGGSEIFSATKMGTGTNVQRRAVACSGRTWRTGVTSERPGCSIKAKCTASSNHALCSSERASRARAHRRIRNIARFS